MRRVYQKNYLGKNIRNIPLFIWAIPLLLIILFISFLASNLYNPTNNVLAPTFKRQLIGSWEYQGQLNSVKMAASLGKTNEEAKIKVEREKSSIEFDLPMTNSSLEEVKNDKNNQSYLLYKTAANFIEARYQLIKNGLKEEIILNKIPSTNIFQSRMKLNNLIIKITPEGIPVFYDQQGKYQFHFSRPFAQDAKGATSFGLRYRFTPYQEGSTTIVPTPPPASQAQDNNQALTADSRQLFGASKQINNPSTNYILTVEIDPQWLRDSARLFPIIIDPTVVYDAQSEFAAGSLDRVRDVGTSEASPSLESYYHEMAVDNNTVGLWHMDETANDTCSGGEDVCDSSGNGNDGTVTGTTITTTNQRVGTAARDFSGAGDYISLGTGLNSITSLPVTIEAWIKIDSIDAGSDPMIVQQNESASNHYGFRFGITQNSALDLAYGDGGAIGPANRRSYTSADNTLVAGQWYHVAGVINGNTHMSLYVNGVRIGGSYSGTGGAISVSGNGSIGRYVSNSTEYFNGIIDEVRVSNVARTPDEIMADAQRTPYAVYTSDVIEGTAYTNSVLSWAEAGVNTGDGETVYSSTNLVAQWNFNEASGTNANNDAEGTSCGGTPANCDGTLNNFSDTSDRDVGGTNPSGWTTHKRWGTGALRFDGADDYVKVTDNDALDVGTSFSAEVWIKSYSGPSYIYRKVVNAAEDKSMQIDSSGKARFYLYNAFGGTELISNKVVNDNQWHYLAGTYDGSTANLYIDGILDNSKSASGDIADSTGDLYIGQDSNNALYFKGVMDSLRWYTRTLSASEILSNYNAGNIEFQTRSGSSTDPNDGTWEAWKPVTSETVIDSVDHLYNISDSGLVSYWSMDETADNSCASGGDACDAKSSYDGAATGTTITTGRYSKARDFNGSSDSIDITDQAALRPTNIALEAWVKPDVADSQYHTVIAKQRDDNGGSIGSSWTLYGPSNNNKFRLGMFDGFDWHDVYSTTTASPGTWYYLAATYDGTTMRIYVNGIEESTTPYAGSINYLGTRPVKIGAGETDVDFAEGEFYDGTIDEVRLYNTALSADTILQHWQEGEDALPLEALSVDGDYKIKMEGDGSQRINFGAPTTNDSPEALWHFDETDTGVGSTFYDSSGNNNYGVGTSIPTTVTDGFAGKARNFDGSTNYIKVDTTSGGLDIDADPVTIEAWIKADALSGTQGIVTRGLSGTNGYALKLSADNLYLGGQGGGNFTSATTLRVGKWYHVAGVTSDANSYLYVNGDPEAAGTVSVDASTEDLIIGANRNSGDTAYESFFNGIIDEVRIYNSARSAADVYQDYEAGRTRHVDRDISSTDLSVKTKIPFYVASDRKGTFLEAIFNESGSAFANYEPDDNTVGLWHFEEETGTGAFVLDSSSSANNLSLSATVPLSTQGKIGKGWLFRGNDERLTNASTTNMSGMEQFTLSAWIWPYDWGAGGFGVILKQEAAAGPYWFTFYLDNDGTAPDHTLSFQADWDPTDGTWKTAPDAVSLKTWSYVAVTYDGSSNANDPTIYVNGVKQRIAKKVNPSSSRGPTQANIFVGRGQAANYSFEGIIDEARVDNTIRSADEIRAAYEIGLRSHPITIDFKAALDSGNLITDSNDKSFTVDETDYGSTTMANHLFKGDKIILKENVSGTEYEAQGTVDTVNSVTGAVTVTAWDSGSTFPSSGYTVNATVFKWQREWFDPTGALLGQRDGISTISLRMVDGYQGANVWLDDFRSAGPYLTDATGSTATSTSEYPYFQFRAIFSSYDRYVSPSLSSVTLTSSILNTPSSCRLEESRLNNQIIVNWADTNSTETGYEIEKNTNNAGFTDLTTADADATSYTDNSISGSNTYQYRIRALDSDAYSSWCYTSVLNLGVGGFQFEGLQMEGLKID